MRLCRGLHQLDQHAFAAKGQLLRALWVDKADVVSRGAFADAAGGEAHALRREPRHGGGEVINPQADVVERG